ncbi:MAG: hypothetical protein GY857_14755 [Desulfobacula sp.]|nr:hypothetical protein [Desulfobacula sp.]
MARLVKEALVGFEHKVKYTKVITRTLDGATRYKQILKNNKGLVPVPSIIIRGQLAFKTIPAKEELVDYLNRIIQSQI